ncbi:hypothetical protein JYU05_01705 [bacterium AH-315-P13]|nr:hypothetical protein [bacterium AH-315-P13]MBN4085561.1 hypothetical protein [Flavobacteriaceae bacterium AH-315-B10]
MITHKLSFGEITILQEDIAEVIVNHGVEINLEMVGEYHEFLLTEMRHPFSVLVNILNCYTYTFEAQQQIGTLIQFNSIAIVAYREISKNNVKNIMRVQKENTWKIKIFDDRQVALNWLKNEQQNPTNRLHRNEFFNDPLAQ